MLKSRDVRNMDACLKYVRQEGTSITTRLVALNEMIHYLIRSIRTDYNQAFQLILLGQAYFENELLNPPLCRAYNLIRND